MQSSITSGESNPISPYNGVRTLLSAIGPAFVVSVGYMDPGNWATNLAAGAGFAYELLWVILLSNIIAIFLQIAAAKIGVATGKDLAQLIREYFPRSATLFLGITTTIAVIATDLAEFLGGALGFTILFHIPLLISAICTGLLVMGLLMLGKNQLRRLEFIIIGLVGIICLSYVYETSLVHPDWAQVLVHTVVPHVSRNSILVGVSILGATVMPHNVFLHSSLSTTRLNSAPTEAERHSVLRLMKIDTITALNVAFLVNAAMLVVAGTVFYQRIDPATIDLQTAYVTLRPLLGTFAALAFGIGLLASGISSSTTGTWAGQVIFQGFLNKNVEMWIWRLITIIPALCIIAVGFSITQVLVISQAILSMQLPFTMLAVLMISRRKDIMGVFVNTRRMHIIHIGIATIVTVLNIVLLVTLL